MTTSNAERVGQWMMLTDAAVALGVSTRTIERRIRGRQIESRLSGGRREVWVSGPAAEAFLRATSPTTSVSDMTDAHRRLADVDREVSDGLENVADIVVGVTDAVRHESEESGGAPRAAHQAGDEDDDAPAPRGVSTGTAASRHAGSSTSADAHHWSVTDHAAVSDVVSDVSDVSDASDDVEYASQASYGRAADEVIATDLAETAERFQLATLTATRQLVTMCDERMTIADREVRSARRSARGAWGIAALLIMTILVGVAWGTARITRQGAHIDQLGSDLTSVGGREQDATDRLARAREQEEALRAELEQIRVEAVAASADAHAQQALVEMLVADRSRIARALEEATRERTDLTRQLGEIAQQDEPSTTFVIDPFTLFDLGPVEPAPNVVGSSEAMGTSDVDAAGS